MKLGMLIFSGMILIVGSSFSDGFVDWFESESPDVGLAFLKIGVGGRALGMAGAYSAVADDATSSYWNPAGLTRGEGGDLVIHHNEHFQGLRHEFFGVSSTKGGQGVGFAMCFLHTGDLELRTGAQEEPSGHFGVYDFSLSLSYARELAEDLALGLTLKGLHERLYVHTVSGWALDIGLLYPTELKGLLLGAVVQNLGPGLTFKEEGFRLPVTYRLGLSYRPPLHIPGGKTLLAIDGVKSVDSVLRADLGLEYEYQELLKARIGYKLRYDTEGLTFGLGLGMGRKSIDYAYIPYSYQLGSSHLITLSLGF